MDIEQLAGAKPGSCEIESLLRRGGMRAAYEARRLPPDRPDAIRILLHRLLVQIFPFSNDIDRKISIPDRLTAICRFQIVTDDVSSLFTQSYRYNSRSKI